MCQQRLPNEIAGRFENDYVSEDRLKCVCLHSYFFYLNTLKRLKMKFNANTLSFKRQS